MKQLAALTGFVLFTVLGNYFFRRSAGELAGQTFDLALVRSVVASPVLWGGAVCYGMAAVFWFLSLTQVPLNVAVTVSASTFVLITLMAFFLFGEPIPPLRWGGIGLVFLGLVVIGRTV